MRNISYVAMNKLGIAAKALAAHPQRLRKDLEKQVPRRLPGIQRQCRIVRTSWRTWVLAATVLLRCAAGAQSEPTIPRIPRVTRAPKLMDFLEGRPREAELAIRDFRQMDPRDGAPVSQETTAYLSHDGRNLYVGWVCKDDPAKIRARITRREDILSDDRISIGLDTFHTHKRNYWFDTNPFGVQMDGITVNAEDDFSFETLWYTEGKLTGDGYVVLQTIPFRSLRFPEGPKQIWGIYLGRFIMRDNEQSFWPFISRSRFPQWTGQFGDIEIDDDISPGRNLQFIPYGLFSNSRYLDGPNGFRRENEGRAGLDSKIVLKDAFTIDLTVNPDFSQVESDEPQVTVNQRYEVVYPERRPFFMESDSLFKMREKLFFSRRIVDPQFGARVTGMLGRWTVGFLAADDRAPGKLAAAGDPLHRKRAADQAARVERGFGHDSHVGLLGTNYSFGASFNRVGALDARVGLGGNWYFLGQATASQSESLAGEHAAGPGYYASLQDSTRHFDLATTYLDRSPGFRVALGYIPRVDIREWDNSIGYRWRPEKRTVVSFGPSVTQSVIWDHQGELQNWSVSPRFTLELLRVTQVSVSRTEAFERFTNIDFRGGSTNATFNTDCYRWLTLTGMYERGDAINYYPAVGPAFLARSTKASAGITLRPRQRVRYDLSYMYDRLGMPGTGTAAILNNHILRSKLNYQFTRAFSARLILDYNSVLPNAALVSLEKAKRLSPDLLFTYLLHPGTAVYVGYTSAFENLAYDPAASPTIRRTLAPGLQTSRQVFVKVSYLLRY